MKNLLLSVAFILSAHNANAEVATARSEQVYITANGRYVMRGLSFQAIDITPNDAPVRISSVSMIYIPDAELQRWGNEIFENRPNNDFVCLNRNLANSFIIAIQLEDVADGSNIDQIEFSNYIHTATYDNIESSLTSFSFAFNSYNGQTLYMVSNTLQPNRYLARGGLYTMISSIIMEDGDIWEYPAINRLNQETPIQVSRVTFTRNTPFADHCHFDISHEDPRTEDYIQNIVDYEVNLLVDSYGVEPILNSIESME